MMQKQRESVVLRRRQRLEWCIYKPRSPGISGNTRPPPGGFSKDWSCWHPDFDLLPCPETMNVCCLKANKLLALPQWCHPMVEFPYSFWIFFTRNNKISSCAPLRGLCSLHAKTPSLKHQGLVGSRGHIWSQEVFCLVPAAGLGLHFQ